MMLDNYLEEILKDPEKRVKLYIAFNIGVFLVNIAIIVGLVFLFIRLFG